MHHTKAIATRNRQTVKDAAARIGLSATNAQFAAGTGMTLKTVRGHLAALFGPRLERQALAYARGQMAATAAEARRNIAAAKARKDARYFPPPKPRRPRRP